MRFFWILSALTFTACSQYTSLWGGGASSRIFPPLNPQEKLARLNYATVRSQVLLPMCISCHGTSGSINLESYGSTKAVTKQIYSSVFVTGTMPKSRRMTQDQSALLYNWLIEGAPEGLAMEPSPAESLEPTFASIDRHIFQVRCVTCHSPGNRAEKVPLTRENLLNPESELVIPGRPDDSELVISIERTDRKRMPPAKAGYAPLSTEEKAAIRAWVAAGARD